MRGLRRRRSMELHTISIDLGKTVFHPITRLPGLRHFADRLLGSWTVNFCSSITRARTLSANWSAHAEITPSKFLSLRLQWHSCFFERIFQPARDAVVENAGARPGVPP